MSTAKVKTATAVSKAAPIAAPIAAPLAANDAVQQIEEVVAIGKETIENAVKASQDAAAKAQTVALKSYEDVLGSSKETVEAMVQAGTILSQGLQDIGKAVFSLAQESIESSVAASKQMMEAKTLSDVIEMQAALSKQSFDRLMGESTRLSDLTIKLVEDAFGPLTEKVNATVDKLVKNAA